MILRYYDKGTTQRTKHSATREEAKGKAGTKISSGNCLLQGTAKVTSGICSCLEKKGTTSCYEDILNQFAAFTCELKLMQRPSTN